jgi:hypothetical protein
MSNRRWNQGTHDDPSWGGDNRPTTVCGRKRLCGVHLDIQIGFTSFSADCANDTSIAQIVASGLRDALTVLAEGTLPD